MSVLNRDEVAAIVQDKMKPLLHSIRDMAECIAILTARLAKLEGNPMMEAKKAETKDAPKVEKKESKPQINVMGRK